MAPLHRRHLWTSTIMITVTMQTQITNSMPWNKHPVPTIDSNARITEVAVEIWLAESIVLKWKWNCSPYRWQTGPKLSERNKNDNNRSERQYTLCYRRTGQRPKYACFREGKYAVHYAGRCIEILYTRTKFVLRPYKTCVHKKVLDTIVRALEHGSRSCIHHGILSKTSTDKNIRCSKVYKSTGQLRKHVKSCAW